MRGKAHGRFSPGRSREEKPQDEHRWLLTYADAVTLLLAFFVMLYSFSEVDMMRFSEFLQGLRTPFGNVSADTVLDGSDGILLEPHVAAPTPGATRDEIRDWIDRSEPHRQESVDHALAESSEMAYLRARAEKQLDAVEAALDAALTAAGYDHLVDHHREDRGLVVTISSDDILFATGSTTIRSVGRAVIEVVSTVLHQFDNPVQIEGHTDDVPIHRTGYTNWNLSTDRAIAVLQEMIERHDLPPIRVGAVGYGEHRPVDTNETVEGRGRNRRVDVVVLIDPWEL